jgi:hypothetical protein
LHSEIIAIPTDVAICDYLKRLRFDVEIIDDYESIFKGSPPPDFFSVFQEFIGIECFV